MFEGWLIKFGENIFPAKYITPSSYHVSPETRKIQQEWYSNRGKWQCAVGSHRRAVVSFETKMGLHQKDMEEIQRIIKSGISNENDGSCKVNIWNPETASYKQIEGKIDDIDYVMRKVDTEKKDIIYDSIKIRIKEY